MALSFKKFTELSKSKPVKKLYEQDGQDVDKANMEETPKEDEMPKANLPENIEQQQIGQTTDQTEEQVACSPAKLFSKLFEAREMAHIYHLQAKGESTYAAHMALGDFYDAVLELNDSLIETYQGQYEIVEGYETIDTKDTNSKDKIEYLEDLAKFIKVERKCISEEDTHLHNIIDEVVSLTYRTLYKLKYLK